MKSADTKLARFSEAKTPEADIVKRCRNGHRSVPDNITTDKRCAICRRERRDRKLDNERQEKRRTKQRERTVINRKLRADRTVMDDGPLEIVRANKIFALMDRLERSPCSAERRQIQKNIEALS